MVPSRSWKVATVPPNSGADGFMFDAEVEVVPVGIRLAQPAGEVDEDGQHRVVHGVHRAGQAAELDRGLADLNRRGMREGRDQVDRPAVAGPPQLETGDHSVVVHLTLAAPLLDDLERSRGPHKNRAEVVNGAPDHVHEPVLVDVGQPPQNLQRGGVGLVTAVKRLHRVHQLPHLRRHQRTQLPGLSGKARRVGRDREGELVGSGGLAGMHDRSRPERVVHRGPQVGQDVADEDAPPFREGLFDLEAPVHLQQRIRAVPHVVGADVVVGTGGSELPRMAGKDTLMLHGTSPLDPGRTQHQATLATAPVFRTSPGQRVANALNSLDATETHG